MKWGQPWEIERIKYKAPQGEAWLRWYAWYPIKIPLGKTVWLEWVEWRYHDGMAYNLPEYREIT